MTTADMLREVQRGATHIQYDPNHHTFDVPALKAAGVSVALVPKDRTPTGKSLLTITYVRSAA